MTFNIGGADLMLQAANMSEMAWFFHRERLPSANAWTMTLVATEACPGFQAEQVSMCSGNTMPTGMGPNLPNTSQCFKDKNNGQVVDAESEGRECGDHGNLQEIPTR